MLFLLALSQIRIRKLAHHVSKFLAGLGRQNIVAIHVRIRQRINDRTANGERDLAQETLTDGVIPLDCILARLNLSILERDDCGQLNLGLRLPSKVALARKCKLGRATKLGLGSRRIKINRLLRKGRVLVVQEAPEVGLGFLGVLDDQELVGMALVADFRLNCIMSCTAHLLRDILFIVSNSTRVDLRYTAQTNERGSVESSLGW